jgi:hypothetical protein
MACAATMWTCCICGVSSLGAKWLQLCQEWQQAPIPAMGAARVRHYRNNLPSFRHASNITQIDVLNRSDVPISRAWRAHSGPWDLANGGQSEKRIRTLGYHGRFLKK